MIKSKALYIAYITGVAGQRGLIAGVDVGTMQYDGSYNTMEDGSI
jgi:hypothetical protein